MHLVDVEGASGRRVVGWTLTRRVGAVDPEPAARPAVELLEGRMRFDGVKAPAAIRDPEAFLAHLDTEVYGEVA